MKKPLRIIVPVIIILVVLLTAFAFAKKAVVGEGEAGVTSGLGGTFTIYAPGEVPYAIPFLERYATISTSPKVVSFIDEEAVPLESGGEKSIRVESQVTYSIVDIQKAVKAFGIENTHQNIRDEIGKLLRSIVKEAIPDIKKLDSDTERPLITATIHLNLNDLMKDRGVSISGYQLRYR